MKSFAKISSLFALIIIGRYLQPAAIAPVATTRPTATIQALPLALARYTATPLLTSNPGQPQAAKMQSPNGYFL